MLTHRHILEAKQFEPQWLLEDFFPRVQEIKRMSQTPSGRAALRQKLVGREAIVFMGEPSTRTGLSFTIAAQKVGMSNVFVPNALFSSSLLKGESFENTVEALCEMRPDVIVIRHPFDDAGTRAAEVSKRYGYNIPIFDAGSGRYEHPTQSLLNLYTIWEDRGGSLSGFNAGFGGDVLNSRVCRSDMLILGKFPNVGQYCIAPRELWPPVQLLKHLEEKRNVRPVLSTSMRETFPQLDYICWGRLQIERIKNPFMRWYLRWQYRNFRIGEEELTYFKDGARLMHPLPIYAPRPEITPWVQMNYPHYMARKQMGNGLYVRMTLFLMWLENNPVFSN